MKVDSILMFFVLMGELNLLTFGPVLYVLQSLETVVGRVTTLVTLFFLFEEVA